MIRSTLTLFVAVGAIFSFCPSMLAVQEETRQEETRQEEYRQGRTRSGERDEARMRRQESDRERQSRDRRRIEVKDPELFAESQENPLFSGPQPGETLPPFTAVALRGDLKDQEFDPVAIAAGKPQVLVFQDESGVGLRGMIGFARIVEQVAEKSGTELHYSAIFLGDDPAALSESAMRVDQILPPFVQMGVSPDGREGPGTYGLDRNVGMTILIARDGKVIRNFVFPQSMLIPDPHVTGAIAEVLEQELETVAMWLNEPAEPEAAMASESSAEDAELARKTELRRLLGELVKEGKITRLEASNLYFAAFPSEADTSGR